MSPSVGEKPQFLPFFGFRYLVLSTIGNSLTKLNTGSQLRNFAYPTASKLFLYSVALVAKSGAQSLAFKSVTNSQTNRETNKKHVFGHPGGGWNPSPTKLGMVIEDLKHVLAPPKLDWCIVSPLGGAENLGITRHPQLKTTITPVHNPLSKSNEILTPNASWNEVQICKFCENRARDTPLRGVYISHFGQSWVKISVFGVLVVAPMGWNLARRRWPWSTLAASLIWFRIGR